MSGHTPGPWVPERGSDSWRINGDRGYMIGRVFDNNGWPQNESNARLISAAPELLDALSELVPMVAEWHTELPEHVGDNEGPALAAALAAARAAIAKATGETS